jgi:hypothetical protein
MLSNGLDYWESGLDQNPGLDPYDSFIRYQRKLLREYDHLTGEFGFVVVNARHSITTVQANLRRHILPILSDGRKPLGEADQDAALLGPAGQAETGALCRP